MPSLLPVRHTNYDFFACNIFDAIPFFKDDMVTMEHPVFSLSTKPDKRVLRYEHNGNTLTITPSYYGLATIHDKDILLYCAGYIRAAMADGHQPSQIVRFTSYDFFLSTNRKTDGDTYQRFRGSLDRLSGTRLTTNIKTGGLTIEEGFGLVEWWRAVKEDETGRVIAAEIKLSDWFYNAIISNELLAINRDYFRLRKPMERRLYEIAHKHIGTKKEWSIGLEKLQKKTGSSGPLKEFRRKITNIIKADHLPDYHISMVNDLVTFTRRERSRRVGLDFIPQLKPETIEQAKRLVPGYDVYGVEQDWRESYADKEPPKNPDKAFLGFCKKWYARRGPAR